MATPAQTEPECFMCRFCGNRVALPDDLLFRIGSVGIFKIARDVRLGHPEFTPSIGCVLVTVYCGRCRFSRGIQCARIDPSITKEHNISDGNILFLLSQLVRRSGRFIFNADREVYLFDEGHTIQRELLRTDQEQSSEKATETCSEIPRVDQVQSSGVPTVEREESFGKDIETCSEVPRTHQEQSSEKATERCSERPTLDQVQSSGVPTVEREGSFGKDIETCSEVPRTHQEQSSEKATERCSERPTVDQVQSLEAPRIEQEGNSVATRTDQEQSSQRATEICYETPALQTERSSEGPPTNGGRRTETATGKETSSFTRATDKDVSPEKATEKKSSSVIALEKESSSSKGDTKKKRSSETKIIGRKSREVPKQYSLFSSLIEPIESPSRNPGIHTVPDDATKGYFISQTMLRIKDPEASLNFYTGILGMSLLRRMDMPFWHSSSYLLGYEDTRSAPRNPLSRTVWTINKKGTIELAHCWDTDSNPEFKGYHNGNSEPMGYGFIGITVDDTYKACERFERLGVEIVTKPDDPHLKGIALIRDPDGYFIQISDPANYGRAYDKAARSHS